jgi:hypothetical protein
MAWRRADAGAELTILEGVLLDGNGLLRDHFGARRACSTASAAYASRPCAPEQCPNFITVHLKTLNSANSASNSICRVYRFNARTSIVSNCLLNPGRMALLYGEVYGCVVGQTLRRHCVKSIKRYVSVVCAD